MLWVELRQYWEESFFFRGCVGVVLVGIAMTVAAGLQSPGAGVTVPSGNGSLQNPADEVLDPLLSDVLLTPTPEQVQIVEEKITALSPAERQRYNQKIIQWRKKIGSQQVP